MRSYASASSPSAASTYSSSSSSTGTAISRYEPPPPMLDAQAAPASIVVRPDLIEVKFAVRAEADAPETALAFLEQTIRAMQPRFAELGAGPTTMKLVMRGHHVEHGAAGLRKGYLTSKSKSEDESTKPTTVVFAVSLQGSFEYTLPAQHDYWDRARLVTKIDALREQLTTHSLGSSDTLTRLTVLLHRRKSAAAGVAASAAALRTSNPRGRIIVSIGPAIGDEGRMTQESATKAAWRGSAGEGALSLDLPELSSRAGPGRS